MQVHGHRGARALRPENTIPAFRYAIEQGVDFIELDVLITLDDVVVVTHDPHINPAICTGPSCGAAIRDLTWDELQAYDCGSKRHPRFPCQEIIPGTRIPSLDEVLALGAHTPVRFNIEAKMFYDQPELTPAPGHFAQLILDLLRQHDLTKRVLLQSFDPRILEAMRRCETAIPCGVLFETDRDWSEIAAEVPDLREGDAINPQFRLITSERVDWAHRNGFQVMPWTANSPEDWATLATAGVDGIITDDPAALIAWLRERGLR